jgi:hypothetical protein
MRSHRVAGRRPVFWLALVVIGLFGAADQRTSAQVPPAVLRLSPEQAVASALEHNLMLKGARLGPQLAYLDVHVARTVWTPQFSTRLVNSDSETPPANPFDQAQAALLDRQVVSEVLLGQQLPWGTSVSRGLDRGAPIEHQFPRTLPTGTLRGGDRDTDSAPAERGSPSTLRARAVT